MDQLKKLLLSDELEQLNKLTSQLEALEFQTYDEASIIQKVTPLLDKILLQTLQQRDSHTLGVLSEYISKIILDASDRDLPALSHALQGVISPAITREIEENKSKMVDALYPIMGSMITKYVTQSIKEMMEKINEKVEHSLSFETYKRKFKSRISGVSESELLLQESNEALLYSLFIIHKESGLLIAQAHIDEKKIDDPHLVASMASAIKDFINHWIEQQEEHKSEVQIVSYGDATLYIESAGSVYLIAFFDAEPNFEQRKEINHFFADIITQHSSFFQSYEGDSAGEEVDAVSQKIETHLSENLSIPKPSKSKKSSFLKIFLGGLLLLLFLYFGQKLFTEFQQRDRIKTKIYEKTGYHVAVDMRDHTLVLHGTIQKLEDAIKIKQIAEEESTLPVQNALTIPIDVLARILMKADQHTAEEIAKLKKEFTRSKKKTDLK